ncbi:hypothetical protein M3Y95_00566100 [Aphelenchoides besseyi]|nr:hypothetical protein M3Y95_00566100 [Aphelenchoides besseyi]
MQTLRNYEYLNSSRQLEFCNKFLTCEMEMMDIHKKCTGSSRNNTAQSCGLMEDFNELSRLMQARVQEFGSCVAAESFSLSERESSSEEIVIPETKCEVSQDESESPRTCWESVGMIKRRCQKYQLCCPAVKTCLRLGKETPVTKAVREKHVVINRKSMECRDRMRLILQEKHNTPPKTHGVVIDAIQQNEEKPTVSGRSSLIPFRRPPPIAPARLETSNIKMPVDRTEERMALVMRELSRILLGKTETTTTARTQPTELPTTTTTESTITTTYSTTKHHHKHKTKVTKNPLRDLVTQKPHFSFALPTSINLTELNLPAARPHLLTTTPALQSDRNLLGAPLLKSSFKFAIKRKELPTTTPEPLKNESTSQLPIIDSSIEEETQSPVLLKSENVVTVDGDTDYKDESTEKQSKNQWAAQSAKIVLQTKERARQFAAPLFSNDIPQTTNPTPITSTMSLLEKEERLVKLLRRVHLAPEDRAPGMRLRKLKSDHTTVAPTSASPTIIEITTQGTSTTNHATSISSHIQPIAISADTNQPLLGYRHHILSIRRRIAFDVKESNNDAQVDDADENYVETNGWPIEERTTIANRVSESLIPLKPQIDIRRAPQKSWLPQPPVVTVDEKEKEQIRNDLIRNLEEYVERSIYENNHRRREQAKKEEERLVVLRRSRSDYENLNQSTGYCEQWTTCSYQLRFLQAQCQGRSDVNEGTKMPEIFRRRFGSCNAKLWSEYQVTDELRLRLLQNLEDCVVEEIANGRATISSKCSADWPVLPTFDDSLNCDTKTKLVHSHCTQLGRCCESLKVCRVQVEKDPMFSQLNTAKQSLNSHAIKCKAATTTTTTSPSPTTTSKPAAETPDASRLI